MGEYINYNGKEIKLGTCESLYYTRLSQLKDLRLLMNKLPGNLDVSEYLDAKNAFRYRFPFPEEDHVQIGDFEPYNKGLVIQLHDLDTDICDFEHYDLWHSASANGSYNVNVCVPCPQSDKINTVKHSPLSPKIISIKQQKQIDGEVWTVIACPYCDAMIRLNYESACKLTHSIKAGYIDCHNATESNKEYYQKVIDRILQGYTKQAVSLKSC
jgi:hypothetical protein